jgi:RNA polymerase sigma-70 factor, ECF subfamily
VIPDAPSELDLLLRRIAERDREALRTLYMKFGTAVFSLARRILSDSGEAEDVLQEVFVQVWREAASFDRRRGTVPSWLMSIARNRSIDRLRSRRRGASVRQQKEQTDVSEPPPGVDDDVAALTDAVHVRRALGDLPEVQRQALLLAYFGGNSHSEIAESLGIPIGTVKSRISAGLLALRAALATRGGR